MVVCWCYYTDKHVCIKYVLARVSYYSALCCSLLREVLLLEVLVKVVSAESCVAHRYTQTDATSLIHLKLLDYVL